MSIDKLKSLFIEQHSTHGSYIEEILVAWEELVEWTTVNNKNLVDYL